MQRLDVVGEGVVNWLRFLIGAIPFPGIRVGRHVPRGASVLQDPERLAMEGAESLRKLARVLQYLEDKG